MRISVSRLALLAGLLVLSAFAWSASSDAATLTVTDLGDDGSPGQLRTLINAAVAGDTIIIPAGAIALGGPANEDANAGGDLDILKTLTIQGAGAGVTIIDGNFSDGVFDILAPNSLTLSGVTIQNGINGAQAGGGGIRNFGTLTLSNAVVSNNEAAQTTAGIRNNGGGIRNLGIATLSNVVITGNLARGNGGGVYNEQGAAMTLTDVTLSANKAEIDGGGIYNLGTITLNRVTVSGDNNADTAGGGIFTGGSVVTAAHATLTNVTVSGNRVNASGGGIFNTATASLTNVTVAGNEAGFSGGGIRNLGALSLKNVILAGNGGVLVPGTDNCAGTVTSLGNNLDSGAGCALAQPGDLSNTDPLLGPLQNNGGFTFTQALLAGSPAIDAGTNVGCPPTAQNGVTRPQGPACDIGAYEVPGGATVTPPPAPEITLGPVSPTKQSSPTFAFTDADSTATLLCALDAGAFAACTSPQSYLGLAEGSHTFFVKANNLAGDSATTSFTWTIDLTAPAAIIDSKPLDPTNQTTADFAFHATEPGSTLECSLDSPAFAACTSPASFSGLADGLHSFAVRATDLAGNTGNAASFSWTIDTQAPDTVIDTAPANPTNSNTATFTFHAAGAVAFTCQLDALPAEACSSPKTYSGLGEGSHTFTVRATDALGNPGPAAAFSWVVDQTLPTVTITTPADGAVYVLGTTVLASYSCADLLSGVASCAGPVPNGSAIDTASVGPKTFRVNATDNAGNSATQTVSYSVVAAAPTVSSLMAKVDSLNLNKGNKQSLKSKLQAAQASLDRGNRRAAVNQLGAFINEVRALKNSRRLDAPTAASLIADAMSIIQAIGLPTLVNAPGK